MGGPGSGPNRKPAPADLPMLIEEQMETCLAASPSLRTLTERQRKFAVALSFMPIPNYGAAARIAGYTGSCDQDFYRTGSAVAHHPTIVAALVEMGKAKLGTAVRLAADTLIDLAENAQKEADRIRAASEILSRSGVSGVHHIEVKSETTVRHEVTLTDEDRQRFKERCERLGIALKNEPLLPAPTAEPIEDASFVEVKS